MVPLNRTPNKWSHKYHVSKNLQINYSLIQMQKFLKYDANYIPILPNNSTQD